MYSFIKKNRWGLGLLVLAWVFLFGQVFLRGNVFFLDDLKIIYYPLEHAYAEFQANGDLPLWSTTFGFGHPLLAWGQLGFFTPLHVILRLFGVHPLVLLQISVASHFLVGLLGMFTFLRLRSFNQFSSAVGAAVFALGGFSMGHLNHVNFYTGTMLLPLLLLAALALIKKPTVRSSAILTLTASAIILSAQPQIVLFTFIAAAAMLCVIALQKQYRPNWQKIVGFTITAGIVAFFLSSLAILPLFEFLPETERNDALPQSELLEFSYPPKHAITLILPYFYGDHDTYWGAKGFQELAAFTGIIPLFLGGFALWSWKTHRSERSVGVFFIAIAIIMALGRYSPLYTFLVDNHYVTTLGVASRFVFFFDIGIALLAACGLSDIARQGSDTKNQVKHYAGSIIFLAVLFSGFFAAVLRTSPERQQLALLLRQQDPHLLFVLASTVGAILVLAFTKPRTRTIALASITIGTLVMYGWNYNPSVSAKVAFAESPLLEPLQSYNAENGVPGRLYSRPDLIQHQEFSDATTRYTEKVSPTFKVYQPIPVPDQTYNCVLVPLESSSETPDTIYIGIHDDPRAPAKETVTIPGYLIGKGFRQRACFTHFSASLTNPTWVSITSPIDTNVSVALVAQSNPSFQAFLVRKDSLTDEQWAQSQKPFQVLLAPEYKTSLDNEAALLARHMQVLADSSSARWIGALSIREYRNFIEFFFANDAEPLDGDGRHVIERFRSILNSTGITHLAQSIPPGTADGMEAAGFELISSTPLGAEEIRVYRNPEAFPKTYIVPGAIWKAAADETRHAMSQPGYNPSETVFISGPKPPETILPPGSPTFSYQTTITRYEPTQVDVSVQSDQAGYLILNDSTTPQWQTYIDDVLADQLVANSVFKAAFVPEGDHVVSFRYESPATDLSKRFSVGALIITGIALIFPTRKTTGKVSSALREQYPY